MSPKQRAAVLAGRLGLLLAVAPFVALAAFNQPFFDDFRNAVQQRAHGLWGVQAYWFGAWTGRFTTTFLLTALNPVSYGWLGGVKAAAVLFMALLWAAVAALLRAAWRLARPAAGWSAALLLALLANGMAAPFSFLYWFSGAVVYQLPLVGLLGGLAWLLARPPGPRGGRAGAWLAGAGLVLAATGNELTLVQAGVVAGALAWGLPAALRPRRAVWRGWALAAGAAAAVAVAAPGNWVRAGIMAPTGPHNRWLLLLPRAAWAELLFLADPMISSSLLAALLLGIGLGRAAGPRPAPLPRPRWAGWLLAYGALNSAGFVLFSAITGGAPLMRAQNEILLVGLLSTATLGWALGRWGGLPWAARAHRGRGQWPLAGLLAGLVAGLFATGHVRHAWAELLTSAAPYDAQMQARYAALRAAHRTGRPAVQLPALRLAHALVLAPLSRPGQRVEFDVDLTPGCEGTINGVFSRYFDVPQVCGGPPAPLPGP